MSIVLTGANGQVGHAIQKMALISNVSITAYTRAECDITNYTSTKNLLESTSPGLIINAAAYTAVDAAEENAELAFEINQMGCENLAKICYELDIPLLHISTDYVFDGSAHTPYKETDNTSPCNVYGNSKLEGEKSVIQNCKKYIILRTSWVFGEHGNNFVKTMLRLAKERKELSVVNDQIGCPTSANSIAKAILEIVSAIKQSHNDWGIYHYCDKPETTWYGFAREVFEQMASLGMSTPVVTPITTDEYPQRARRPMYSVLDCRKIQSEFSIIQSDWREDLREVIKSMS